MSYAAEIARSVVRYDPSEKAALREFQHAYFPPGSRHSDDSFFEWLFERNPHRDAEGPSLWLCKRDGIVVGQQASIPVLLKVGDREHRAAWLIDWLVHPDWRLKGVAPALLAANANSTELMLGLSVENLPYRTVLRAGWKDVGRLSLFVRPFDVQAFAKVLGIPVLISKLAPRTLVGGSAYVAAGIAGAITGIAIEPISAFDERVNGVWAVASLDYPVLVKRDFASLRWRFDDGPQRAIYQRYYFKRRGQIIGYAVLRLSNWRGVTVGRVVDYLAERRCVSSVLALVIDELNKKSVAAVFIEQRHTRSEPVLRSLGCLNVRASNRQRFMYYPRDPASPLAATLAQADRWFITPADADFDDNLIASESGVDRAAH